jgi:hypothetical protein
MPFHHTMGPGTTAEETGTGTYIVDDPRQSSVFEVSTGGQVLRTMPRETYQMPAVPFRAPDTGGADYAAGEWESEGGGELLTSPFFEAGVAYQFGEEMPVVTGGLGGLGAAAAAVAVAVDKVAGWVDPGFEVSDIWERPLDVAIDIGRGAIEEVLGFDFGDDEAATAIAVQRNGGSNMTMMQTDRPGLMDFAGSVIDLLPGGDAPGETAVKRALGRWLGPVMITAGPTSNRWGGWVGSYKRYPNDKRKRGFYVDMRGSMPTVQTWRYQGMAVISNNPRVKSVAKAARIVDRSVSNIVKVAKVADRAESKLKTRRKKR